MSRPHRPAEAATGPDPAIAAHWASELAWWAERAQVDAPVDVDVDELPRYRALHDGPADSAVDAIIVLAFATAEVQRSVSAAGYADARRLRGPGASFDGV